MKTPHPEPGSGQRYGETCAEFFNRQDKLHLNRQETETIVTTEARLQRQHAHQSKSLPGKEATVYQWVDYNGFRIRTLVNRYEDIAFLWDYYSSFEIRYNSWENEWDLSTEFGDSECHKIFDLGDEPLL